MGQSLDRIVSIVPTIFNELVPVLCDRQSAAYTHATVKVKAWLTRTSLKSCGEVDRGKKTVKEHMGFISKYRGRVY